MTSVLLGGHQFQFNPHITKPCKFHLLTTHLHAHGNERVNSTMRMRNMRTFPQISDNYRNVRINDTKSQNF